MPHLKTNVVSYLIASTMPERGARPEARPPTFPLVEWWCLTRLRGRRWSPVDDCSRRNQIKARRAAGSHGQAGAAASEPSGLGAIASEENAISSRWQRRRRRRADRGHGAGVEADEHDRLQVRLGFRTRTWWGVPTDLHSQSFIATSDPVVFWAQSHSIKWTGPQFTLKAAVSE
jgi:hypothetical protein